MKKPTTITPESVSEYREFVELCLRKRVLGRRRSSGVSCYLDTSVELARSMKRSWRRCAFYLFIRAPRT